MTRIFVASAAALTLFAGACTPAAIPVPAGPEPEPAPAEPVPSVMEYRPLTAGLPAIPRVEAPVEIQVIQPTQGSTRPGVDSTAVYGSVGTGGAALEINGRTVPVAPNGAFIAYLPVPSDGIWRFAASRAGSRDTAVVTQRIPSSGSGAAAANETFATPRPLIVAGADTLASGSDAPYARPTPTGTYRWFFPAGARLSAVERRGGQYRVRLDDGTTAWIDTSRVTTAAAAAPSSPLGSPRLAPSDRWVDVRLPAGFRPFLVEADSLQWRVTVYGGRSTPFARTEDDALVREVTLQQTGESAVLGLRFNRMPWGYKAFYDTDGTLVLRVRRPPAIDAAAPLRGRRIMIDPGHPPAGATGPTGLRESEANLAIGLALAEMLRAAGAEVLLTRTGETDISVGERTAMAVRADAELLVSVHNNAFGDGQDPFRAFHTTVYHFQPFSADLARALDREIVAVTGLRDLGARMENLALARPTWMPSALTESVFMPIPEQENALRDAAFVRRLAEAHLRGIEAFLRQRAER